jgi:hypothetical protein
MRRLEEKKIEGDNLNDNLRQRKLLLFIRKDIKKMEYINLYYLVYYLFNFVYLFSRFWNVEGMYMF